MAPAEKGRAGGVSVKAASDRTRHKPSQLNVKQEAGRLATQGRPSNSSNDGTFVKTLADYGLSESAIMAKLGVPQKTISRWLNHNTHRELNHNSKKLHDVTFYPKLSQPVTKELAKWGILLNIRALENYLMSNRFPSSLFFW